MSSIQTITDQHLIDAIKAAKQRVVFVAPGIWPEVAESLSKTWQRLGPDQVSVILDIDAEVCRFGYGSIEGLELLKQTADHLNQAIGHEPGIRICIVIADEQTFIFSPTPRLIESSPDSSLVPGITAPRANGIVLSSPPPAVERDLGATPEQATERTIGMEAVDPKAVETVAKDLKYNPPKTFDVARAVNVYNAAIQFAELKVSGCQLSGHKARLPSELIKVVRKNPLLDKKIDKSLHLIEDEDELVKNECDDISEVAIFAERKRIEEKFLVHVKGGTVIDRKKKEEMMQQVKTLQALIEKFAARVKEQLNGRYLATAEILSTELLPDVLNDIPERWLKRLGSNPNPSKLKFLIEESLLKSFGNPDRRINAMKAEVIFKDVTYDMLKEPEFIRAISEHFPDLKHMEEYTAAKESTKMPKNFTLDR